MNRSGMQSRTHLADGLGEEIGLARVVDEAGDCPFVFRVDQVRRSQHLQRTAGMNIGKGLHQTPASSALPDTPILDYPCATATLRRPVLPLRMKGDFSCARILLSDHEGDFLHQGATILPRAKGALVTHNGPALFIAPLHVLAIHVVVWPRGHGKHVRPLPDIRLGEQGDGRLRIGSREPRAQVPAAGR